MGASDAHMKIPARHHRKKNFHFHGISAGPTCLAYERLRRHMSARIRRCGLPVSPSRRPRLLYSSILRGDCVGSDCTIFSTYHYRRFAASPFRDVPFTNTRNPTASSGDYEVIPRSVAISASRGSIRRMYVADVTLILRKGARAIPRGP